MIEQATEIESLDQTAAKAAEDTTMDGDFTPAEQEGLAEYKKLMDAIEKGEEYTPEPAADVEQGVEEGAQAEYDPKADDASKDQEAAEENSLPSEEELSAILTSHAEAVTSIEAELKAAEERRLRWATSWKTEKSIRRSTRLNTGARRVTSKPSKASWPGSCRAVAVGDCCRAGLCPVRSVVSGGDQLSG